MTFNNVSQSNHTSVLDLNSQMSSFLKQTTTLDTRLADTGFAEHQSHSTVSTGNSRHRFNLRKVFQRAFASESQATPWDIPEAMPEVDDHLSRVWAGRGSRSPQVSSQLTAALTNSSSTALANSIDPSGTLLSPTSNPNTLTINTSIIAGTLRADHFTLPGNTLRTVISGNGNVGFGAGFRDTLDLSNISSTSIGFNLAYSQSGGVAFNPGTGTRIFDAINFQDGRQILFEGIDQIRFSDRSINLSVTPNDSLFNQQWNLHMMGVQNAWRFTTGSSAVLVGIQDSGLAANQSGFFHPDLNLTQTSYFPNNIIDENPNQTSSHGTAVQSIIAATSNNQLGMSGINWNSSVIHIDMDDLAYDLTPATEAMLNQAISNGQRLVINMSLGQHNSRTIGATVASAFERLVSTYQNRVLFVVASGNENDATLSYPAQLASVYNNVIAVGASWGTHDQSGRTTQPGTRISYGFPPTGWGSNYGDGLTLMGPSEVIAARATDSVYGTQFDINFAFNGTSAATPNVTGVASLVWSANPNLTAGQVKSILTQTAVDLGSPGYDPVTGSGFVNADAAVRRAIAIGQGFA